MEKGKIANFKHQKMMYSKEYVPVHRIQITRKKEHNLQNRLISKQQLGDEIGSILLPGAW